MIDSPRARYHDQFRAEIIACAWEQVCTGGLDALSIKAIATRMGVSAAALYRYIDSRDDLLDELSVRAATELSVAVESVPHPGHDADRTEHVLALADRVRRWAAQHPGPYLLIYGHRDGEAHIPDGVVAAERRTLEAFASACATTVSAPPPLGSAGPHRPRPRPVRDSTDTGGRTGSSDGDLTDRLDPALTIWTRLLGVVGLEMNGHFAVLGIDVDAHFEREIRAAVGASSHPAPAEAAPGHHALFA